MSTTFDSDEPSAAGVHDALTNVGEVGAALIDVFKRFKNDKSEERFVAMSAALDSLWASNRLPSSWTETLECAYEIPRRRELVELMEALDCELETLDCELETLDCEFEGMQAIALERGLNCAAYRTHDLMASFATVVAAIDRWFEAKQVAARQIERTAYLVDDLMAEGPQPSTVLCDKLDELERGCGLLTWLYPTLFHPGKMHRDSKAYCRDYSELPLDQVSNLRGHWDKRTGLLDRSVHGDVRSGEATAGSRASRMTRQEANIKARQLLNEDAGFADKSAEEWSREIPCSIGLVSYLPTWEAVMERTGRGRKDRPARPKAVSLPADKLLGQSSKEGVLEELIAQQRGDAEPSPLDPDPPLEPLEAPKVRKKV